MQVDLKKIMESYKDMHTEVTYQVVCLRLAVTQLEEDNRRLKKQIADMENAKDADEKLEEED